MRAVLRFGGIAGAAVTAWWALEGPAFRGPDGAWSASIALPIAIACALCATGGTAGTRWAGAGRWLALAAIGQAAAVLTIDAGPRLRYQHYLPLQELLETKPLLVAIIVVQAAIVLVRFRHPTGSGGNRISRRRVAIAGVGLGLASVVPTASWGRYAGELIWACALQAVSAATALALVLAIPAGRVGPAALARPGRFLYRPAVIVSIAAVLVGAAAAVLCAAIYGRHPHVPDEVSYLIQARTFAAGWITLPALPVAPAFDIDLMTFEPTRWYSPLPPGWPVMLAVGTIVHGAWLVNPLLGAVNILLSYRLLRRWMPSTATKAALLMAASPWYLFLAMSFMTHMFMLTLALSACLLVARRDARGGTWSAAAAGLVIGLGALVRPLDAVILAVVIAVAILAGSRPRAVRLRVCAAGLVVGGLLTPIYNRTLTGSWMHLPLNAYFDRYHGAGSNDYGFGANRGLGWPIDPSPGHGPVDGSVNTLLNLVSLNQDLLGWAAGSFVLVAVFLAFGRWTRGDWLALGAVVLTAGVHFFYYFSGGPDFGARYWFLAVVPLAVLSARGLDTLTEMLGERVRLGATVLILLGLVVYVPWRALDKYRDFRGMRPDIPELARQAGFDHALVLIRGDRFPDYESAAVYNSIPIDAGPVVYTWDRDATTRDAVVQAFPGRRIWIVDGPTITGSTYRVVRGPLTADAVIGLPGGRP